MNTLTLDQAKDIFRSASLLMQDFIIGYIKVGDRFEPAISDSETFMPLSSFGISNVYISDKFIPFPDGKNLSEMLKSPLEYHEWCKQNLKMFHMKKRCPNNCFDGMVKHYPIPESALFDLVKCPHCKGRGYSDKPIE